MPVFYSITGFRYWAGACLLTAAGCSVYVPTVPSTPLVQRGQVEVTAGLRTLTTLEAGAAFSPKSHVLFSGEAALQRIASTKTVNNVSTQNLDTHQQVGLGVGAYTVTKSPSPLYLAAVAGMGYADVDIHDYGVFGFSHHYQGQYQRYYGQLYLAALEPLGSYGVSVRGTWVDYRRLLEDGVPIEATNRFFLEPHLFGRIGRGPLQGYATLGFSLPAGRERNSSAATSALTPSSLLLGAGIIFRPHLLRRPNTVPTIGQ